MISSCGRKKPRVIAVTFKKFMLLTRLVLLFLKGYVTKMIRAVNFSFKKFMLLILVKFGVLLKLMQSSQVELLKRTLINWF